MLKHPPPPHPLHVSDLQCITSSKIQRTGEISVRKGPGRRPLLDARDLRALRRHCITHRHDSVIDITKWAQEYFQKTIVGKHNPPCHLQMPTKALSCKKEGLVYFNRTMQNHILQLLQQHGFVVEESGC